MGNPRDEDDDVAHERAISDLVDDLESVDENEAILEHIRQQDPYGRYIDGLQA